MERFFEELGRRRFMVPRCDECGKYIYPPRDFCPFCNSRRTEWVEVEGEGTLYAFTTNPEGLHFAGKTVGIVELKEGFKVFSLINASIDELEVGQPVKLEFTEVDLGGERKIILHSFTPIQK